MQRAIIFTLFVVALVHSVQSWSPVEYPLGLPGLANKASVALSGATFVGAPETQWVNVNDTQFYPTVGRAPWLQEEDGLPLSVRFNGSQCLSNDLNSSRSIPLTSDFVFMAVFKAPSQGTHTLFAQQSSPTEGYVINFARDATNVQLILLINGNVAESSYASADKWPVDSRMIVQVRLSPQSNGLLMTIEFFGLGSGGSYAIPAFSSSDKRTLIGCSMDGSNYATADIFDMVVSSKFSSSEVTFAYALLTINHGLDRYLTKFTFTNEEFKANVTGISPSGESFLFDNGTCRSAELVLSSNSTANWTEQYTLVGHNVNSTLEMIPLEGNVSRSARVWYLNKGAPLAVAFDPQVYELSGIDWSDEDLDFKHMLLYSESRDYNWTVLATVDANNGKPASFDTLIIAPGYITYAFEFVAANRTVEVPIDAPIGQPESVPQQILPVPNVAVPASISAGSILGSIFGSVMILVVLLAY